MRGARRLTYADSRMKDVLLTLLHLAVMAARLCGPGGVRTVIAENLVLKQQLIVLRRGRRRARRRTISCCLSTRFSAITARTPPGPHSFAVMTATWSRATRRFLMRESA